jgi:tRNA dimethylallyltransferase
MFIVIGGATGTGKSSVAVELAKLINGEIVSADSMQVYRKMDIGTYKIPAALRQGIPHHMIDVADPRENFSASRYKDMAGTVMDGIKAAGKVPIMAGGTGFYINAVIKGIMKAEEPSDDLRKRLREEADSMGLEFMSEKLRALDPEAAAVTDLKNSRRVLRALELIEANGVKLSELKKNTPETAYRDTYRMYITVVDREKLYNSLDARVEDMVKAGLVDEVRSVLKSGAGADSTALQAIGYKEINMHLGGKCSFNDAVNMIKQATRNYAKRQETWFKKYKEAKHIDMDKMTPEEAADYINDDLNR